MFRCISLLVIAAFAFLLPQSAFAKLEVVATTPDLAAIAREVGGADVHVIAMALPTQDPHFVDAKPHLALALSKANLLVLTGAGLEVGWLPTLLTGSRNADIQPGSPGYLDCSSLVPLLEVPTVQVDRSQGDIHPQGNPHFSYDPRRVETLAVGIGKRLAELDSAHKPGYFARTKGFVDALKLARARWEARLLKARGLKLIAYHNSLVYLTDWLGLEVVEHIEPKPGIPPNPSHVAHVLEVAKASHVRAIVQQSFYPSGTSKLIADKAGATFLQFSGYPDFAAGQSYSQYMDDLVGKVAHALGI
ncbi:MAG TPA: zinc ABC transporter substrate-binding protein [Polyangiaceae bacterium]|nr:zinc ABC transporter substrate-binding protein [Polyangiaceae bacterium]